MDSDVNFHIFYLRTFLRLTKDSLVFGRHICGMTKHVEIQLINHPIIHKIVINIEKQDSKYTLCISPLRIAVDVVCYIV